MSYPTVIPANKVNETELIALVEQIQILTKTSVTIERQFVITAENVNVSSILDSLVDAMPESEASAHHEGNGKPNGKAKKSAKAKAGAMTSHQVRFDGTGEIISTQAFNKRLAAGEITELTGITNAKGEQFVVIDGKLAKGLQS